MSAKRITVLENRLKTQKKSPRQSQPAFRKQQAVLRRQIAQLKAALPKRAKSSPPPTQRKAKTPRQLREARAKVSAAAKPKTVPSYDYKKERPSTTGQRREAARRFGRQEETVEHEGRLQRIPGSVVGPNERFKRVTREEKQKAADLTELGIDVATLGGLGPMVVKGAKMAGKWWLTTAAKKKLEAEAKRKAKAEAKKKAKAAAEKKAKAAANRKAKADADARKQADELARQTGGGPTPKPKSKTKPKPKSKTKPKPKTKTKTKPKPKPKSKVTPVASKAGLSTGEKALIASLAAGTGTMVAADYKTKKKQAQDITDATARRKALDKISAAESAAERATINIAQDRPATSATSKPKAPKGIKPPSQLEKEKVRGIKPPSKNGKKKDLDTFDKDKDIFHKIAYGLSKITGEKPRVEYDYPSEREDIKDLNKGGKIYKPSRKQYSMNRGGKVASVRKPTRA